MRTSFGKFFSTSLAISQLQTLAVTKGYYPDPFGGQMMNLLVKVSLDRLQSLQSPDHHYGLGGVTLLFLMQRAQVRFPVRSISWLKFFPGFSLNCKTRLSYDHHISSKPYIIHLVDPGGPVVDILISGSEVCRFDTDRGRWIFFRA